MAADPAFERHLQWLLDGRPVGADAEVDSTPTAKAVRIVDAIARVHRTALFGSEESPDVTVTKRWGHLDIRDEIGRGASGTVYRAWDTRLAREVALKLWSTDAGHDAALEEGRLLARLNHPHIVRVFGADIHDGVAGIWMELLEGDSLEDVLARDGVFGVEETLLIGRDLASALAAVHAAGLLHRDVKTRNVIRERGGRIVLMDLGAGRAMGRDEKGDSTGTPLYMAPEVLRGGAADTRSDLYGLGVLLFRLLTAAYPVQAANLAELRDAHAAGRRVPLAARRADVAADVRGIIDHLADPDPDARPANATEAEAMLSAALKRRVLRRAHAASLTGRLAARWRGVAASAAAVATLIILALASWNTNGGRAVRHQLGLTVAPRSPAYLTLPGAFGIVQGGWFQPVPHNPATATTIAVTTAYGVRTMAGMPPWVPRGAFRLDGTPVAPPTPQPPYLCCFYDGTTDGRFNYAARSDNTLLSPIGSRPLEPSALYRFTLDWTGPEPVFPLAEGGTYHGVAYSAITQSFWLTRRIRESAMIEEWSGDGRHLGTPVHLPTGFLTGIGVDPLDGTLWVVRTQFVAGASPILLENYTTRGHLLGSFLVQQPFLVLAGAGLEFAWIGPSS